MLLQSLCRIHVCPHVFLSIPDTIGMLIVFSISRIRRRGGISILVFTKTLTDEFCLFFPYKLCACAIPPISIFCSEPWPFSKWPPKKFVGTISYEPWMERIQIS